MHAINQIQEGILATLRKNNEKPILRTEEGLDETREAATSEVVRKSDDVVIFEGSAQQCADYIYQHGKEEIFYRSKFRTQ